jgi:hypothetical protein
LVAPFLPKLRSPNQTSKIQHTHRYHTLNGELLPRLKVPWTHQSTTKVKGPLDTSNFDDFSGIDERFAIAKERHKACRLDLAGLKWSKIESYTAVASQKWTKWKSTGYIQSIDIDPFTGHSFWMLLRGENFKWWQNKDNTTDSVLFGIPNAGFLHRKPTHLWHLDVFGICSFHHILFPPLSLSIFTWLVARICSGLIHLFLQVTGDRTSLAAHGTHGTPGQMMVGHPKIAIGLFFLDISW